MHSEQCIMHRSQLWCTVHNAQCTDHNCDAQCSRIATFHAAVNKTLFELRKIHFEIEINTVLPAIQLRPPYIAIYVYLMEVIILDCTWSIKFLSLMPRHRLSTRDYQRGDFKIINTSSSSSFSSSSSSSQSDETVCIIAYLPHIGLSWISCYNLRPLSTLPHSRPLQ